MFESINPYTQKILGQWPEMSMSDAQMALNWAHQEFDIWHRIPLHRRLEKISRLGEELLRSKDELSLLMTDEMGKPLSQARDEVEKSAWACKVFSEQGASWLLDEPLVSDDQKSYITYRPLGVILAIMPWNFPIWQVVRCALPALAAGNTVLFKPSANVSLSAFFLYDLMLRAGFPPRALQVVRLDHKTCEDLLKDTRVRGLSFTGSTTAGKHLASIAGAYLKKSVLELGGSDPYLILGDAPLELAVEKCLASRLQNNGQSCIAAKRLIVEKPLVSPFIELLTEKLGKYLIGNPREETIQIGPLARLDLLAALTRQVDESLKMGAHLVYQGSLPSSSAWFYPPTVLRQVVPGMPVADEETFGPVFAVIEVNSEVEAIELANQSVYGLGAAVFTADKRRGEFVASQLLEVGSVAVNDFVRSDPRSPFGGQKDSGLGRELGKAGMLEFTNSKTVMIG
jgi:succinate-semialdehyde dehydrogenase/glutarate-semialdehyde dehydrogenase